MAAWIRAVAEESGHEADVCTAHEFPSLPVIARGSACVQARHTGIKIVQQIAILLGCGVLPHLKALVGHRQARPDGREPEGEQHHPIKKISVLTLFCWVHAVLRHLKLLLAQPPSFQPAMCTYMASL